MEAFLGSTLRLEVKTPCSSIAMRPLCILIRSTERVAGRGRKDLGSEILKCHDFPVVLNYCFQIQRSLFIEALIEWDEALHRSAGIDARGTDKAWQQLPTHDRSIEQRPKEWNLRKLHEEPEVCSVSWVRGPSCWGSSGVE